MRKLQNARSQILNSCLCKWNPSFYWIHPMCRKCLKSW